MPGNFDESKHKRDEGGKFSVGDRVQHAKWGKAGTVLSTHQTPYGQAHMVKYDDGSMGSHVPEDLVKHAGQAAGAAQSPGHTPGMGTTGKWATNAPAMSKAGGWDTPPAKQTTTADAIAASKARVAALRAATADLRGATAASVASRKDLEATTAASKASRSTARAAKAGIEPGYGQEPGAARPGGAPDQPGDPLGASAKADPRGIADAAAARGEASRNRVGPKTAAAMPMLSATERSAVDRINELSRMMRDLPRGQAQREARQEYMRLTGRR